VALPPVGGLLVPGEPVQHAGLLSSASVERRLPRSSWDDAAMARRRAASLGRMPAPEPAPRSRAPRSRTAEALDLLRRNRDFRLMFVAQLISLGGDWFLSVALFGLVFEFTGSPALVSALIATMSVPYAVMTFVGGPLADRIDRR